MGHPGDTETADEAGLKKQKQIVYRIYFNNNSCVLCCTMYENNRYSRIFFAMFSSICCLQMLAMFTAGSSTAQVLCRTFWETFSHRSCRSIEPAEPSISGTAAGVRLRPLGSDAPDVQSSPGRGVWESTCVRS